MLLLSSLHIKPTIATHALVGALGLFGSTGSSEQEPRPPSLPYVAVHNPEFIAVREAAFMNADDRVIGLMSDKTAKAYPAGILAQHGLVEDDSPKGSLAITC
jgi:hypothetical protein